MAFAYTNQGAIVVPPRPQIVDPRALILPPAPVQYAALPFAAVANPRYPNPVLFPAPVGFPVDFTAWILMDGQRTQDLLQFMGSEGLVPPPEEEAKRKDAIRQLKEIVWAWIRKVAWQRNLPKDVIAITSATILTYGSYGLGVHGSESDIDALCVGPYFATLEEDFFVVLHNMLQSRPEVSDIHCVKTAKVPLMRFKFNGISIDLPYAQLHVYSVPHDVDIFDDSLQISDETSWRSLSGVRVNARILQLVPNLKNFQSMLRCIKLWAKRRGVYSHLLGFFGGIHLAVLAAYVCQRHPAASINTLISLFFDIFSHWPWPEPVILQDKSIPYKFPDGRSFIPIMMPCSPFEYCNSNITKSTFSKIKTEFQHGYLMTRNLWSPEYNWSPLFEPFPYAKRYESFVRIFLTAPDGEELGDWVGWVKSRFRSLLLKLEMVLGYCDPNPTEYVDHNVAEPNVVYYWGLSTSVITLADIDFVKEDFMKSVNNDIYSGNKSSLCKLELSIIKPSELPKNIQMESSGTIGSKACWRIPEYSQMMVPVFSRHMPNYFVGCVASDRGYVSAAG